jgi:hypothetical protein
MGRLRFAERAWIVVIILFVFLPACGGHKPPAVSSFPAVITLNPSPSYSLQMGTAIAFSASARNASDAAVAASFTYTSSNPGVVDVAPNGFACAGSWNAPLYTICTPGGLGSQNGVAVEITASASGVTSAPTLVFVHPFISSIKISVVPPVNSPPPACPTQTALPAACKIPFKAAPNNACLSQNQLTTLQATAYDSGGNDITASVGPFTWSQGNLGVATLTPIVTVTYYNVPTNQATATPGIPGQTQVIASASGVSSEPYVFETCPVQCIALELNVSGSQQSSQSSFVVNKGTSQSVTAYAVDVQGCLVPKPQLTWMSSEPAALSAGGASGCSSATSTCTISTTQPGVAAISASCMPPSCNVGFPLNLNPSVSAPYIPQPVYPVTAISGLVTGAPSSTSVLATSQDCYSDVLCSVGVYNILTTNNLPEGASPLPAPPNSLIFDPPGDRAFIGSQFGAFLLSPASLGTSSNPFSSLPAPGTPRGLVTGKILAVSLTGGAAIFSDTVSTPNQVYAVNASPASTLALNINSAIAAAFSPDGREAFILGDGGNTLYIYSTLQPLQPPISLPAPATSIAFSSTGSFALLSGGSPAGTLAAYNTCDNSPVLPNLSAPGILTPPMFLRMVPAGNVPMGNPTIPNLQPDGLDFFFGIDDTGIDIIATTSSQDTTFATLCPQKVTLAQTTANTPFPPIHVNIRERSFQPINFFLSPDSTQAYIVTSDLGILIYNFDTNSTSGIPLVNDATAIAADMTVDGTMIYVAGSDGLLHQVSIPLALDQTDITFLPLVNSANAFCYTGSNCDLNIVAIKP